MKHNDIPLFDTLFQESKTTYLPRQNEVFEVSKKVRTLVVGFLSISFEPNFVLIMYYKSNEIANKKGKKMERNSRNNFSLDMTIRICTN